MAKYDYLRWDAASIQQLLRRKLLQSNIYTDQLYPGSDTKILIDLFAWTFDALTYIMNNNAANAIFQDVQIYQNMNRIVKLLSYNPVGYLTAVNTCIISINNNFKFNHSNRLNDTCIIPKFSSLSLSKTDKYGNPIKFSFIQDFIFTTYTNTETYNTVLITPKIWPLIYNGQFKKYFNIFTAVGVPYEVFTLVGLTPNSQDFPVYLDHNHFHVYIQKVDQQTGQTIYTEWRRVENLILQSSYADQVFQMRLNEVYLYTIKFGDNIHGKQLLPGSNIHIIYLQSNGQQGILDSNQLVSNSLSLNIQGFQTETEMLNICFGGIDKFKQSYSSIFISNQLFVNKCQKFIFSNIDESIKPKLYENVSDIRTNAPNIFKMGNRLITLNDFKNYILTYYNNFIKDIWVCNNTQYTSIFYNWLYEYNALNIGIRQYSYLFTDACDFNNVYLWCIYNSQSQNNILSINNMIVSQCNDIKCATASVIPCKAIEVSFIPYIQHIKYQKSLALDQTLYNNVKIRLVKKQNTFINNQTIRQQVSKIIIEYFESNMILGKTINLTEIQKKIIDLRIYSNHKNSKYSIVGQFIDILDKWFIFCMFYIGNN